MSTDAAVRSGAQTLRAVAKRVGVWLKLAAPFTGEWVGKAVALVLAFAFGYVGARALAEAAFWTGFLALEIAGLILLAVATAVGVWWAFGTEHVHTRLKLGRAEPLAATLLVLGFAVGTFAGLTTLFYEHGQLDLHGRRVTGEATIIGVASDFYMWHILDSLPLVDIPQTIRWEKPYEYSDSLSGWLLLAFKGFVILPLVQVVRLIFAGPPKSYERSVLSALPRALLGLRVVREAKSNGYTHALLQYGEAGSSQILFVVVDVMRELWTEDAALRALDRVLAAEFRPQAYLLVVDAVADRARERIEDAFARAPFAALLAVWRGDQPVDDLAQAVKPLARQLSELTRS